MDTFGELFCLGFLGFYSLLLLALVVAPLFRYGRFNVLNRRKQTGLARSLKPPPVNEPRRSAPTGESTKAQFLVSSEGGRR